MMFSLKKTRMMDVGPEKMPEMGHANMPAAVLAVSIHAPRGAYAST